MASHDDDLLPENTSGYKISQPKQSLAAYQNMGMSRYFPVFFPPYVLPSSHIGISILKASSGPRDLGDERGVVKVPMIRARGKKQVLLKARHGSRGRGQGLLAHRTYTSFLVGLHTNLNFFQTTRGVLLFSLSRGRVLATPDLPAAVDVVLGSPKLPRPGKHCIVYSPPFVSPTSSSLLVTI